MFWKGAHKKRFERQNPDKSTQLRLILHIGPHKTGTTSLQRALLKQFGSETPQKIWYPAPEASGPGHAIAVWQLLGRKGHSPSPAVRQFIERATQSDCRLLIVSSEGFASTYPNKIKLLAEQISEVDLHIVVTLSPIVRRALSTWQETVKHRSLLALDSAGDTILTRPGLAPQLVRSFVDTFPDARISIIIANHNEPKSSMRSSARQPASPFLHRTLRKSWW